MNIHPNAGGFVIAAGAILGICAGLLWTAQGSLMLAYPTESQKGRFISIFWSIFNLGAVVGSSVALGTNFHSTVCAWYSMAVICDLALPLPPQANAGKVFPDTRTPSTLLTMIAFESRKWNLCEVFSPLIDSS
jgi:hypothetical protein